MYEIRKINSSEVMEALSLALEVFLEFEAPDYQPKGVVTFKRDIVQNDDFISKCRQGICPIYAAFDAGKMIGIMGMRSNRTHINLAFTRKEYHRQGVATSIFQYLLDDLIKDHPTLKEITLNSSPYGKAFYLHIGFEPLSDEQEIDGIRFTPMKYTIDSLSIEEADDAFCEELCERYLNDPDKGDVLPLEVCKREWGLR